MEIATASVSLSPGAKNSAQANFSAPEGYTLASISIKSNGYNGGIVQSVTHTSGNYVVVTFHNMESATKNVKATLILLFIKL